MERVPKYAVRYVLRSNRRAAKSPRPSIPFCRKKREGRMKNQSSHTCWTLWYTTRSSGERPATMTQRDLSRHFVAVLRICSNRSCKARKINTTVTAHHHKPTRTSLSRDVRPTSYLPTSACAPETSRFRFGCGSSRTLAQPERERPGRPATQLRSPHTPIPHDACCGL